MKKLLLSILVVVLGVSCSDNSGTETVKKMKEVTESKPEPIAPKKNAWQVTKVVDEFGDEVEGEGAIIGLFDGKMSNSATSNSDLKVKVQVGSDNKSYITFFEYGNRQGNLPKQKFFKIKIKKENGETEFIEQFSFKNMLVDNEGVLIRKVLDQKAPLKINVDLKRASSYESTVYNFEIDPEGLKEILETQAH